MELNKWQAIDILDKFNFFQGQRAGRELWSEKPFDVQEQDIANFSRDVALLKDYINELTEENERLQKALNTDISIVRVSRGSGKTAHLREVGRIKADAIRADTARKMQKWLNEQIGNGLGYRGDYIHDLIDIITKEIIEGENKNDE